MKKIVSIILILIVLYVGNMVVGNTLDISVRENVLQETVGKVFIDGKKLREGGRVAVGSSLAVNKDAFGELHLLDGSIVRMDSEAEVVLRKANFLDNMFDTNVQLELLNGRIWVLVPSLPSAQSSFEIVVGSGVVDVFGTSFMLTKNEDAAKISVVTHAVNLKVAQDPEPFDQILVKDKEIVFGGGIIRKGNISHNDRDDLFFRLNDQKDKKHLDNLQKRWLKEVKSVAGILPGSFLYGSKRAFEDFWRGVGGDESKLEKNLKYTNRRLMEAIALARKGQVGTAKEYMAFYENGMDDILAKMNTGDFISSPETQSAWALLGVKVAEGLGITDDENAVRKAIYRQALELVPDEQKEGLKSFLALRMLYNVLDFDNGGFGSEAADAYNRYYDLSSDVFLAERLENLDDMIAQLIIFDLSSDGLSPSINGQFASLRVEYLGNVARTLAKLDEESLNEKALKLVETLSFGDSLPERYLLLRELERDAPESILAIISEINATLFERMRVQYVAKETPEERKSYISSLYYAFGRNEELMSEFIPVFREGLNYTLRLELDTMARGTVYIPPAALSRLEELKKVLSASEYRIFVEDLRYRALDERAMVSAIERRLGQSDFDYTSGSRIKVIYEVDGKTKTGTVPYLRSNVLKSKPPGTIPIPDPVVPDVVTAEEEIPVVEEVITE